MRYSILCTLVVLLTCLGFVQGCSKDAPREQDERPQATRPVEADAGALESEGQELSPPAAETDAIDPAHLADARKLINGGVAYLLDHGDPEGGWSLGGALRPAVTAMVLKALVRHPDFDSSHPVIERGFEILLAHQHKTGANKGGVFNPAEGSANYTTAVAVMAMVSAQDPRYTEAIREAVGYLKRLQIAPGSRSPDGAGITDSHPFVGGVSYGRGGRPDLSNVGMWMQALHDAGISGDDPAMQRALVFLNRTQNRSESNRLGWAAEGENDGGFVYAPAVRENLTAGESKAGPAGPANRGLRSYGSMTYVGFKSMLYADVSRDDPRVQASYGWIRRYWRLDSNPNMPHARSQQGLYYYYHVFAKALRAWGQPVITDTEGKEHNWREELIDALAARVSPDGSWVNTAGRWEESNPVLVTAYAVLALEEALKK